MLPIFNFHIFCPQIQDEVAADVYPDCSSFYNPKKL